MRASKNSQIQGICISGALFLFYAPKILKPQKIILSFPSYRCFNAKIPHRRPTLRKEVPAFRLTCKEILSIGTV